MLTRDIEGRFEVATGQRVYMVSREWLIRYVVLQYDMRIALQRRLTEYAQRDAAEQARKYGRWWRRAWRWVRGEK